MHLRWRSGDGCADTNQRVASGVFPLGRRAFSDGLRDLSRKASGFTFLNPHVYLDTVVLLGSIAAQYGKDLKWTFASGALTASVLWFTGLGFGARLLLPIFQNPKAWRILDTLIALVMWAIALTLVLNPIG